MEHTEVGQDETGLSPTLREAFEYAYAWVAMGRLRASAVGTEAAPGPNRLNAWVHRRELRNANTRGVTTPNSDTLYSSVWLDLRKGPCKLTVPDMHGRYYSIAFLDMSSNNFAVVGRRTTGTCVGGFLIVGPEWSGPLPTSMRVITAPMNDVLLVARILVDGDDDVSAVIALQDQLCIEGLVMEDLPPRWCERPPLADGPSAFIDMANLMLRRNPAPRHEDALLRRLAAVGIGAGWQWDALPPDVRQMWTGQWATLLASLEGGLLDGEPTEQGWHFSRPTIGNFGTDYAYRARIALGALLALEPAEAVYPSTGVDEAGQPLSGDYRYRFSVPAGGIPVNAFWSLSMYEIEADGKLFFAANPINRYTIGDRTPGLIFESDGTLHIWIQRDQPADAGQKANWLPAPAGRFRLVLRAYEPRAAFLDRTAHLPAVERLDRKPA